MLDVNFFKYYTDKEISVIPMRKVWDEKKNIYSGKVSAVSGWQEFCKEVPDDDIVESWGAIKNCSGFAFATGEASNIACIDIDTEDPQLAKMMVDVLPYNPCRIIGHPKRYGKLLYRLSDHPATENFDAMVKKTNIKKDGKVVVDIFKGNAYVVAPPSIHSQSKDGRNTIYYRWYDDNYSLDKMGVENLPLLPLDAYYKLHQVVKNVTPKQVGIDMSSTQSESESIEEATGRYDNMKTYASHLIRSRTPLEQAIKSLMDRDSQRNSANKYFLDRSKGSRTNSPIVNCIKYYADMLEGANKKGDLEIPRMKTEYSPVYLNEWSEFRPIQEEKEPLDIFDLSVVPKKWRALVADVADSNGVPQEICFYLLLTSLSSLIGNKRVITPKMKNKSWEEAHNIWTIYVSPSGTRKSQVLKTLTKYINDIQKKIDEEHREYEARQLKHKDIADEQIKQIEKKIKEEVRHMVTENSGIISDAAQREIDRLQSEVDKVKEENEIKPKKQLVVKSATVEKLIEVLSANKNGTFLEYNELTQLTQTFKKKGYESLRTLLLDSWDGLRSFSYQTKGSGDAFIEKNCTSMYASVQNSVFEKELREIAHDINDDGFYQRSFIVVNESPVAMAIDQEFKYSDYKEAFGPFIDAYEMGESETKITCEYSAYEEYMKFEQYMLTLSSREKISALSSFWGKFTGKVVKVASILEFIDKGPNFDRITLPSMMNAIKLMGRQITHIKNMFPDPNYEHAREIIRLIKLGVIRDGIDHDKLVKTYYPLKDSKTCHTVTEILYSHNAIDIIAKNSKYYYYFNKSLKPVDTVDDIE